MIQRLIDIVGPHHVITDPNDMDAYMVEPRGLWHGAARCVVQPASANEVTAILRLCDQTNTHIVPQGGNTGLVGGQIPDRSGAQLLLSLTRLNRIRDIDTGSNTITAEAGVTLQAVQHAAEQVDRLFPLSLAAEGSCTIGGNLATNAGGTAALAYGTARDLVIGLEVVLADGRVLNGLSKLRKDNTGYDLKNLFIGSEGTLGIITAATLKLFPRPGAMQTAFVGLNSPADCLRLLHLAHTMVGADLKTFEFMSRIGIEFVARHVPGLHEPLSEPHAWYVLLELASPAEHGLAETMLALLAKAADQSCIADAAIAASEAQRAIFWKWREVLPDVQKHEGASIKHDISVPVAAVPRFLHEATEIVEATIPGARPVPFGHLGDGNIHFNVSQPIGADEARFLARWAELNEKVHAIVADCGGSISAEHGIGALKRTLLPTVKDPVAMDIMRALKQTLDPKGLLNPGKVL